MIPGMGSIIVLSGKKRETHACGGDISMYSQWTGAGGGYPQTVIGVMAEMERTLPQRHTGCGA